VTVHYDAFGIATVGEAAGVFARRVVGGGKTIEAVLLHIRITGRAMLAGTHKTTDGHTLTYSQILDFGTDGPDGADNFMSGNDGIIAAPPVVFCVMNIRVTNTAKFDVDVNILRPRGSSGDLVGLQWSISGVRGVAGNKGHL
jgi:hypothetical protein